MSFEANKIAGAILAAMILAMVSGIIANILVHPTRLEKPAYQIAGAPAETAAPSAAAAPAGPEPIAPLMAKASVDAGKTKAQLCAACHSFDKGAPNRIGPNLYGVVGSEMAEDRGGFPFSNALKAKEKEDHTWTLDDLNAWLWKPQEFAKGTKMTFIGLPKAEDRANVIAYLNSLSDHPLSVAQLTAGAAGASGGGAQAGAPSGGAAPGGAAKPAPAPQAATPGPGSNSSNAPTANGPGQTNNAAPRTPGKEQGANPSSSAIQGQQK